MAVTKFVIRTSEPSLPGLIGFIEFYGKLPYRCFTIGLSLESTIMKKSDQCVNRRNCIPIKGLQVCGSTELLNEQRSKNKIIDCSKENTPT